MENFRCYDCDFKTNCVDQIVDQITILHENESLKYRELSLDEVTGNFRYVTQTHQGVTTRGKTLSDVLFTVMLAFRATTVMTSTKCSFQKY